MSIEIEVGLENAPKIPVTLEEPLPPPPEPEAADKSRKTDPSNQSKYIFRALMAPNAGSVPPSSSLTGLAPRVSIFRVVGPPAPPTSGIQCTSIPVVYVGAVGDMEQEYVVDDPP